MRVNGWTKGRVGGLLGPLPLPLSRRWPALLRARTLKPRIDTSKPALVSKPILSISRRLKPAAMISRLFLAACCFSFSALLLIFEMYAMEVLLVDYTLCSLCVLCVSVVSLLGKGHHRDTSENTEIHREMQEV